MPLPPWSQPVSVPGSDSARFLTVYPVLFTLSAPEGSRGTKPVLDLVVLVLVLFTTPTDGVLTRWRPRYRKLSVALIKSWFFCAIVRSSFLVGVRQEGSGYSGSRRGVKGPGGLGGGVNNWWCWGQAANPGAGGGGWTPCSPKA